MIIDVDVTSKVYILTLIFKMVMRVRNCVMHVLHWLCVYSVATHPRSELHTYHNLVLLPEYIPNHDYRSLAKERPPSKEHPSPTFNLISCIGSRFTRMSAHLGASFA